MERSHKVEHKGLADLRPGDQVPAVRTVIEVVLAPGLVTVRFDDGSTMTSSDEQQAAVEVVSSVAEVGVEASK